MSCQLCTQGFVFDLVWTGKHWSVEEVGKCTCYGGTSRPREEIVQLARQSGRHVNKVLLETIIRNVECQLLHGRQLSEEGLNSVLAKYQPEESITAGVPMKDGFVPDVDNVPF